ncbi:LysR family transcriptional regulator [Glacieibacterium megasporae]|uniref:LysR family transcriptional regulator n=1 Tax=Glacieibacterium megasporae TaxID=2835787 RepID=UPI001C1E100C|nr:LysR family transcriptional regulator [Polymorphobacter megasporae]UAJ09906.1 LysR family transcriptional regulator [Polymorphobacter megasporae]
MKRTHLPLNALRVFDAAARHLSFTKAADELAVTPAAVGQQVRALEDVLGTVLFKRMTRNLELTPEAERALPALRAGFLEFEESVRILQDAQGSKVLTLAAPRDFTARWLTPRLAAFARDHDVRFVVTAADDGVDFTQANLDLAVTFGPVPDVEGLHGKQLGDAAMVVVGVPGADPERRIDHPGAGWPTGGSFALTVADAGLAIDAAVAGFGVARVPVLLAAANTSVVALGDPEPALAGYWLVAPTPQWRQAKVRAIVEALTR